ncbi:putative short chain dehydrogenase [Xylariomycetidae sp. FL2044]|nr:putative short chain dehydrogenase [Xylariomycetidae sp. FL2044]
MAVYVITGVGKGIGFELTKQISEDPNNIVVGLVRDKATVEKKVAAQLGSRPNVHILYGDLVNYDSLKQAAAEATKIVGERGVDYLVACGGFQSTAFDSFAPIGALADNPEELRETTMTYFRTNVLGNTHLFHLFLPLVLKGKTKKVIALSSGHADLEFFNKYDVEICSMYAASKAALNVIVAKFSAQYKKQGVLFMSMSPGIVDVGNYDNITEEQGKVWMEFASRVSEYAPDFKGPSSPQDAIPLIRSAWENASIEKGHGGAFVSQFLNKQWV